MAAFNAFKVAREIGDYASRDPEVKVERTKEANLLVTCSTLGARKLAVLKWFGEGEVEIVMGVPREENESKGVMHGVEVELDDEELIEGLKAAGVKVVGVQRLRSRGMPMETVVVTFRGKQVLESVSFGYMRFRVKVYVPRPISVGSVKGLDMWRQGVKQRVATLHVAGIIRSWKIVVGSVRRRHSVATVGVAIRQHIRGARLCREAGDYTD